MKRSPDILLVEDDDAVARGVVDGLTREGFSVTRRATGGDGLAYARQHSPQLAILDVRLAG